MRTKAQFEGLQTIIIILVVIGVLLGIGFLLLEEFKGNADEEVGTITIPETLSFKTLGVYASKNYTTTGINCYNSFVITQVTNATTGGIITAGNYSYDSQGKVWNLTGEFAPRLWNITYTFKYGLNSCAGIVSTINATKKIPTWLSIIIILLIVGIILGITFKILPNGNSSGGGIFGSRSSGGTIAEI
jgi:hypothetical protein